MGKTAQTFGKISRRSFLGLAGATGVGVALTGCAPAAKQEEPAADSLPATGGDPLDYDTVSWSACHVNCGSRCPLKAYVKDGQVVRIDIDSDGDDEFGPGKIYQMRSCVRGRTNRQRIYSPDRIQKPLKRVEGTKRGEGKYEEITWDEAINLIATTMKEIKEEYGNDAFYIQYGTGVLGGTVSKSWHPDQTMFARLMNLWGGYLRQYADYSTGQITWEVPLFNGDAWSNNEVTDLVNSRTSYCSATTRPTPACPARPCSTCSPRCACRTPRPPSWWWIRTCRTPPWAWPTAGSPSAPAPIWRSWPA